MYILRGIITLFVAVGTAIWWGPLLPLALSVWGLGYIGGNPQATQDVSELKGPFMVFWAFVGLAIWTITAWLLWVKYGDHISTHLPLVFVPGAL